MKIETSKFIKSSTNITQCPEWELPEFAFVGRSNVWKSSLINMLTQKSQLARSSNKPWKTQEINHFLINEKRFLVDLPGYWYAKSSRESRKNWMDFMFDYLINRKQLLMAFILIDANVATQKIDIDFICDLYEEQVPFSIVFTKTDKCTQKDLHKNIKSFEQELRKLDIEIPSFFQTSSNKNRWKEQILNYINMVLNW